jgi:hypothetical protein
MMISQRPKLPTAPHKKGSIAMKKSLIAIVTLVCITTSAHADRIDGDWCNAKDERLTIVGPQITLPSGKSLTGQYRRHEFAYEVPAGEADAGQSIYMQQFSDESMSSYIVKDNQPTSPTPWTRCPITPKTS